MLRIIEAPSQLIEHCAAPKQAEAATVEPNVFDVADMSKRLTFLVERDHFDDEDTWTKSVWALRRAFGDAGWPLAERISYADDENRLAGVWKRDDASKASPSTCASLIKASNDLGYRELAREHMFADLVVVFADETKTWKITGPVAPRPPLPPPPLPEGYLGNDNEPDTPLRDRRIDAASLEGKPVPDREWLARDLIPAKNVTLLYGDGGTGKSLLALQLAVAVVTCRSFFGHAVVQGRVEFVTAEDSLDEMHRRLVDISRAAGVSLGALSGLHLTSLAETDAILAVSPDSRGGALAVTALYNELESVIAESRPGVVFLDTLADVFGGNEIIRAQARQFIGMLRRLCLSYGCTIVVLAHPSLAGMEKGTSGSTGWNNSVRSRLYFGRVHETDGSEMDEDARILRVGKSNYGRVGLEVPMRWRAGVFVAEGSAAGGDPLVTAAKAERVFLELLDRANKHHAHVSSKKGTNYAPAVFARDALKQSVKKRDLVDAMQRLLDSGKIDNTPHGSPSRMRYWLERTYIPTATVPPL